MKTTHLFTASLALASLIATGSARGQTALYPVAEATVRDGSNFTNDVNEATTGYLMVKYSTAGTSGKAY